MARLLVTQSCRQRGQVRRVEDDGQSLFVCWLPSTRSGPCRLATCSAQAF